MLTLYTLEENTEVVSPGPWDTNRKYYIISDKAFISCQTPEKHP